MYCESGYYQLQVSGENIDILIIGRGSLLWQSGSKSFKAVAATSPMERQAGQNKVPLPCSWKDRCPKGPNQRDDKVQWQGSLSLSPAGSERGFADTKRIGIVRSSLIDSKSSCRTLVQEEKNSAKGLKKRMKLLKLKLLLKEKRRLKRKGIELGG